MGGRPVVLVERLDHEVAGDSRSERDDLRLQGGSPVVAVDPDRDLGDVRVLAFGRRYRRRRLGGRAVVHVHRHAVRAGVDQTWSELEEPVA